VLRPLVVDGSVACAGRFGSADITRPTLGERGDGLVTAGKKAGKLGGLGRCARRLPACAGGAS
jgi:hypothetical protein